MNVFFIHIPKCGGKTINDKFTAANINYMQVNEREVETYAFHHQPLPFASLYGGHAFFSSLEKLDMGFKYFAVIRHPLARAISFYNSINQRGPGDPCFEAIKEWPLDFFLQCCETNEMCRFLFGEKSPETLTLVDMKTIINEKYLFVANLDYPSDLNHLTSLLVPDKSIKTPHANIGKYPKGNVISPAAVAKFEKENTLDYELYELIGKGCVGKNLAGV